MRNSLYRGVFSLPLRLLTLLAVTRILNIFWTAYLFNCFMNGGWIFT